MNRRNMLYGGVAAAAGLVGAGVAWWKFQPHEVATTGPAGTPDSFWGLSFDTPQGQLLVMKDFVGKPLLVNFWATWCPPCVEELPLLNRFYQENKSKNWQVLGLAVDQSSAVHAWLQRKPLSFPVAMAGLSGIELSKSLGNLAGVLPFSVVFDASGRLLHRKSGKVSPEDLAQWVQLA
ncbi:MAG: TlpA disulfide reductase family protein [Polaromonas sp.]|nr:TlpA disulfide reductase family protein [Polaromonas sp.]